MPFVAPRQGESVPPEVFRAAERLADQLMGRDPRVHGVGVGMVGGRPGVVVRVERSDSSLSRVVPTITDTGVPVRIQVTGLAFAASRAAPAGGLLCAVRSALRRFLGA
jgi:hypothetical protein